MKTRSTSRTEALADVHHLRWGREYRAITRDGSTIGEFIGMESTFGDHAILLRGPHGTASVELADVTSIRRIA